MCFYFFSLIWEPASLNTILLEVKRKKILAISRAVEFNGETEYQSSMLYFPPEY